MNKREKNRILELEPVQGLHNSPFTLIITSNVEHRRGNFGYYIFQAGGNSGFLYRGSLASQEIYKNYSPRFINNKLGTV